MSDGDSDKTIQHHSNDKTMGHESAASRKLPADAEATATPPADSNRTQAGDATVMFSSSGDVKGKQGDDGSKRVIPDVANYEILGELGRGGMGVVYKARNRELNRIVALKMILSGAHASDETIQRFRTEAEAVAQLHHPNIVQVFDVGQSDGQPWCALEFVDGGGLDQILESRELHEQESANLVEQLARAMQSAHVAGIVHRDLKPANILIGKSSDSSTDLRSTGFLFPKITDFGLAKRVEQNASHTQTGSIVGTPSYMSPEQARGLSRIGPSADIYALGAILYRLLTGRPPFAAETPIKTVMQVMNDEPVAPAAIRANVDRDLATICMKCLEKDPARRYPSAEHLAQDLARYTSGEPILARPVSAIERTGKWIRRKPWAAAVIGLAALGLLGTIIGGAVFNAQLSNAYNKVQTEQQKTVLALEAENVAREEAVAAGQLAEKIAEESQRRLVDNYVNNGLQALEQNQPLFALPWFAEAINIDRDPVRGRMHTMRFEAARQRCPQVLDTWLTESAVSNVWLNRSGTVALGTSGARKVVARDVSGNSILSEFDVDGQVIYLEADEDLTTLLTVVVHIGENPADAQQRVFEVSCRDASTFENIGTGVRLPFDSAATGSQHGTSISARMLAHVTGEDSTHLQIHDLESGELITESKGHSPIRFVEFNPASTHLMVVSDRIQIWDVAGREWTWESDLASQPIESSSISLAENVLVVHQNQTRVIDLATGRTVSDFELGKVPISLAVSPDGSRILYAFVGGSVEVHDQTGQLIQTLGLSAQANDFVFRKGTDIVLIATNNQVVRVDLKTGQQIDAPIPATVLPLNSLNLDQSGTRIVLGGGHGIFGGQGVMRVWSNEPANTSHTIAAPVQAKEDAVVSTVLSDDGRLLASFDNYSSSVRLFRFNDQSTGSDHSNPVEVEEWLEPLEPGKDSPVSTVAFSPDSGSLLVCHKNGDAEIRSISSSAVTTRFELGKPIFLATFSKNGKLVAMAAGESRTAIGVFNVADGLMAGKVLECPLLAFEIAFSPDNQALVAVSRDLIVRSWDVTTSEMRWNKHAGVLVGDVAIDVSRDALAMCGGRFGGLPGRVSLLRLSTGEEWFPPVDLNNEVTRVDICSSEGLVLFSLANGTVEIRSISDGQLVSPAINHPDRVLNASLSGDGELLLTVCRDQQVRVFDRLTGLLITSWDFYGSFVNRAHFVRDSPLLVVSGSVATLCKLPGSSMSRDEAIGSSLFISALQVSDQGLVRPVSGPRLNAVAGNGLAIEDAQSTTSTTPTAGDLLSTQSFYSLLSPEMKKKFPDLPIPDDIGKPMLLKYKFKPGDVRQYNIVTKNDMNAMGITSNQYLEDSLKCTCEEFVDSRFRVAVEYESARSKMDTPGGSYSIDTLNPDQNRVPPAFQTLVELMTISYGVRSVYEVSEFGVIQDYVPPQELNDAVKGNSQAQAMSITAKALSSNFVSMWTNWPDHPVITGEQWPSFVVVSDFKPEEIEATSTFLGVATIDGRQMAVVRVKANASGHPYTAEMFGGMTSRSDAIVYFDVEAGCIDRAFTSTVGKVDLNIDSLSLQQLIDGRSEIRRVDTQPE